MSLDPSPPIVSIVTDDGARPLWSVMIPAYNPDSEYLRQALESVLQQDPGPDKMQIEVVDNCSLKMDVGAFVHSVAGDRVKCHRNPKNLGMAGGWNTCIARARGEWVHILHADDLVLPEFYARYEKLFHAIPGLDAAFCRNFSVDAEGHWDGMSAIEMKKPGEFAGLNKHLATWQQIQCAAVVVRRSMYERVGGFRADLPQVLDWEMWCRIAASGRWGYVPQIGAAYRHHPQSESERLLGSGDYFRDLLAGGRIARSNFSTEIQAQTADGFYNHFARTLIRRINELMESGRGKEAAGLAGLYHKEVLRSSYRRNWLRLRARVFLKLLKAGLFAVGKNRGG